jgi:hypothetical protein
LTINKPSLTLLGAEAGVDARFPRGAESIVTDPQGTFVTKNNVILDGFTFQDSVNNAFTGFGIALGAQTNGQQVVNNVIQNNIAGIGLGASTSLIEHNRIEANNAPGSASGDGIYTDQFVSGGNLNSDSIVENAFIGNSDAGIDISNTDSSGGVFNLEVSTNTFASDDRAILYFNTHTTRPSMTTSLRTRRLQTAERFGSSTTTRTSPF